MPFPGRSNNKGEADSCIWFHAHCSVCEQILIIANDTDVWMYGLALLETGYLNISDSQTKDVTVELAYEKEYVNINLLLKLK